jgi:hypothetical protein
MINRVCLPLALLVLVGLALATGSATARPLAHPAVDLYQIELHVTNQSSQTVRLTSSPSQRPMR